MVLVRSWRGGSDASRIPDERAKSKCLKRHLGEGVEIFFICQDSLKIYDQIKEKGLSVSEPFVGNNMWVVGLRDPDGYKISFESPTDVTEETTYSDWVKARGHA
jgi:hypothetical protein